MEAFVSFIAGAIVVVLWFYDPMLAIRTAGLFAALSGVYTLHKGSIPFFFNDRHVENITGVHAALLSLLMIGIGVFIVVAPSSIADRFSPELEYTPPRK